MIKFSENTQEELDEILDSYLMDTKIDSSEVRMSYLDTDLDNKIDDYILNGYQ